VYQCGTNSCEKNPNDNVKLNNLNCCDTLGFGNWNGSISGIKCSGIIGIVKEQ
jgi:hypothetical protein